MGCCFGSFAALQTPTGKGKKGGVTVHDAADGPYAPDNNMFSDPTRVESHEEMDCRDMARSHVKQQLENNPDSSFGGSGDGRIGANMNGSFKMHRPPALIICSNSKVK